MGKITDSFRERIEAGEDRNKLRTELDQAHTRIRAFNGFRNNSEQDLEKTNTIGSWDMNKLLEETRKAEKNQQPTPLDQLKDIEVASVHINFVDIDSQQAQRALRNAQNGKSPTGQPSESAQLRLQINNFAKRQMGHKSRRDGTAEFNI